LELKARVKRQVKMELNGCVSATALLKSDETGFKLKAKS